MSRRMGYIHRLMMKFALRGLYVITDKKLIPRERFAESVEAAIRGGAKILQIREKDTPNEEIIRLGLELLAIARRYNVPLIVNDSPWLAKEIGADGVHLGRGDAEIAEARSILGSEAIIGISCYGDIERGMNAEREGADYLAFGTPYDTPTKPGRKPTPFEVLLEAKRKLTAPIFAIGGITPENARDVLEMGVDGIAAITSVFGASDPEAAARRLAALFSK
ncbi:MAG: thiamine phosphate synthase [Deltaproteobacteria bacterium]